MSELETGCWFKDVDLFSAYDRLKRAGLVKGEALFTVYQPLGDAGSARSYRSWDI